MEDRIAIAQEERERERERREKALTGLRALLDWFETHPDAPIPYQLDASTWHCRLNKDDLPRLRDIGDFEKRFNDTDGDFEAVVHVGKARIIYYTHRDNICIPRVVGKRTVPAEVVPESVIPEHEEDIIEWECKESVLSLIRDQESENSNA